MITHQLKTWPQFFEELLAKEKKFEVRVNDRNFTKGDGLILQEYDPYTQTYTGREIKGTIGSVLSGGQFGIDEKYCVFSILLTEIMALSVEKENS